MVLSTIVAVLLTIVNWLLLVSADSVTVTRTKPIYWALLLPFAYWAVQLAAYVPWALRWLGAVRLSAPVVCCLCVVANAWTGAPTMTGSVVLFGLCLGATLSGHYALRGSLLEGPDRP